jgi:hypothetical protein
MRAWGQAHNEDSRMRVPESRHGLAPIFPISVSPPLVASDLLSISHKPRAARTGDNFFV